VGLRGILLEGGSGCMAMAFGTANCVARLGLGVIQSCACSWSGATDVVTAGP
jgi:hypothetical protein